MALSREGAGEVRVASCHCRQATPVRHECPGAPPKGCAPGTWRPYQDAPESSAVSNLRWTRRRVSSNLGSCRVLLKTRARLTPPKLPVCHLKRSEEHTSELQSL